MFFVIRVRERAVPEGLEWAQNLCVVGLEVAPRAPESACGCVLPSHSWAQILDWEREGVCVCLCARACVHALLSGTLS